MIPNSISDDLQQLHRSVLLEPVIELLNPQSGETYLDFTAGLGGHARAILTKTDNYAGSLLVDRDSQVREYLQPLIDRGVSFWQIDFLAAAKELVAKQRRFDLILLDLGVSSIQLDQADRGFSFLKSGKLDMRMDRSADLTAEWVVNNYSRGELIRILQEFGDLSARQARSASAAIIGARPLKTTTDLAAAIEQIWPRRGKTHPATQVFQAIRLEVNQELTELTETLPLLEQLLNPGGRVAIISFHSGEDRLVKQFFQQDAKRHLLSQFELITKKPIDGRIEQAFNPRSRSAKLRVARKK